MFALRFTVISGVLIVAAACGSNYSSSSPSPTPSPTPSATPSPGGASSPVSIPTGASTLGRSAFMPDALTVPAGTTVTWTNTDSIAHTSTSDAKGWDSGIVGPGQQFSVSLQTPGTYSYHCAIHPGMIGTVVVQ
jgi:plastocyanin